MPQTEIKHGTTEIKVQHYLKNKREIKMIKYTFILLTLFYFNLFSQTTHNWIRTNPGAGGAFNCVAAGPTGIIMVGSDLSGYYRSTDNGQTWQPIGKKEGLNTTHAISIGFDPNNSNLVLAGTDEGIYKSSDGGLSFSSQPLSSGYITDIKFAKSNSAIVYASYHPAHNVAVASIYKSTDHGDTWTKISSDFSNRHILKIVVDPSNENIVYFLTGMGRYVCGPAEVYKSTNGGATFTNISGSLGEIMDFEVDPIDPQITYLSTMNASCSAPYYWTDLNGKLYKSNNYGNTWTTLNDTLTGLIWINHSNSSIIRIIDVREPYPWTDYKSSGTFESTDYGNTWTKIGFVENWDCGYQKVNGNCTDESIYWSYGSAFEGIVKTLGKDMSDPDKLYWITSQFVYSTVDGGINFNSLYTNEVSSGHWQSRGIDNITMYDISISEANPDVIYLGYFDIGLWRSNDNGASWQSCNERKYTGSWEGFGGNTYAFVADPDVDGMVWAAMQGDFSDTTFMLRSTSYGNPGSWQMVHTGLPLNSSAEFSGLSVSKQSDKNNRTLFVCVDGDVYRSTNHGNNWSKVLTNGGMRITAVDRFDGSLVYAGGENGVFRSTDGGNTWSDISLTEMKGVKGVDRWDEDYKGIWDIETDPVTPERVYVVAYGNGDSKGIYKSDNKGTNWTKIKTGRYLRSVAVSKANNNVLYLTSSSVYVDGNYDPSADDGIFYSTNGGTNWEKISGDMTWEFAIPVAVSTKAEPWIFVGSPGTGFQKAKVPSVKLQVKIFLEGPYDVNTHAMKTDINSSIPLESPYSENKRTVDNIPANVVDWVLVELRKSPNSNATVSKSVFLHKNGNIVADDGSTTEIELIAPEGNYYIVIKHRNHLAVMSANTVALNSTTSTLYDFTASESRFYGSGGAVQLESGVWGMWSGDANGSGVVDAGDRNSTWNDRNKYGYENSDVDLSGVVDAADRNKTWNNRNKSSALP